MSSRIKFIVGTAVAVLGLCGGIAGIALPNEQYLYGGVLCLAVGLVCIIWSS